MCLFTNVDIHLNKNIILPIGYSLLSELYGIIPVLYRKQLFALVPLLIVLVTPYIFGGSITKRGKVL